MIGLLSDWFKPQTRHIHDYGLWSLEERVERLVGPFGRTEGPVYYNVRVCACGHRQMERIGK